MQEIIWYKKYKHTTYAYETLRKVCNGNTSMGIMIRHTTTHIHIGTHMIDLLFGLNFHAVGG